MKLKDYELISLAGFLHDIGKIRQRADMKIENEYNLGYCPEHNGQLSYLHAAHTAEFLDWFVSHFDIKAQDDKDNLINVASYHHKRDVDDPLVEIIKKADRLSSGFERQKTDTSENYKLSRLVSIFSEVGFNKEVKEYHYPLKKLSFDIKPENVQQTKEASIDEYRILWNGFCDDIKQISKNSTFDVFYDAIESVYEIYGWCVPSSSYKAYPNISLFDHSKTTAAIAQALYYFHKENGSLSADEIQKEHKDNFIFIQGDFSGIQNFIFSKMGESNKFAAKILRAKSFYVSLLTDLAAYRICKEMSLTKSAIIMNAGGKFTILAPNLKDNITTLNRLRESIDKDIFEQSYGETRFVIDYIAASDSDFHMELNRFSKKMSELSIKLSETKLKPSVDRFVFDDYLNKMKDSFVCKICGKHPSKQVVDVVYVCESCRQFKEIGERLVKSDFLSIKEGNGSFYIAGNFYADFKRNNGALLCFDLNTDNEFRGVAKNRIASYVPVVGGGEEGRYKDIKDFELIEKGGIKPFSCITEDVKYYRSPDNKGSAFLGVLKADLDSLGKLFAVGFGNKANISKTVSLSRMIDFFFTGWLQYMLKNKYTSVYTVFSGGDDLFLIGPFNQIMDLSVELNEHLREYTKNEEIHISCGIFMVKPNIPVYQMAELSEDILKEAKNRGRDAVGVFGRIIKWHRFEKLMDIDLEECFRNDDNEEIVSDGYKYKLLTYANMAENTKDARNARDLMWKPLLSYQTYRNIKINSNKVDRDKSIKKFLELFVDYIETYKGDFVVPLSNYIYRRRG